MVPDTIVAAMRSAGGASAELLRMARIGHIALTATAPLCFEYETVCSLPEHMATAGFSPADATRKTNLCWRQRSTGERTRPRHSTAGISEQRRSASV
jgi:hypothetical protein